jgi:hypothetical protein
LRRLLNFEFADRSLFTRARLLFLLPLDRRSLTGRVIEGTLIRSAGRGIRAAASACSRAGWKGFTRTPSWVRDLSEAL